MEKSSSTISIASVQQPERQELLLLCKDVDGGCWAHVKRPVYVVVGKRPGRGYIGTRYDVRYGFPGKWGQRKVPKEP